jgi:hypothetical protein
MQSDHFLPSDSQQSLSVSNAQQEMIRRWQMEKERREQLEKKNSELCRELRILRQQHDS